MLPQRPREAAIGEKMLKFLFRLVLLGAVALSGYALFAELPAPRESVRITISAPAEGG
ncbi:MAG: hypothetical protein AAFT19_01010 [Pseudomonadota bacterium]